MSDKIPAEPVVTEEVIEEVAAEPKIYWSPSQKGFYVEGINPIIPPDAKEISKAQHVQMLNNLNKGGVPSQHVQIPNNIKDTGIHNTPVETAITQEAARRIEDVAPLWKQSNDMAVFLAVAMGDEYDQTELEQAKSRRQLINHIRKRSGELIERYTGGETVDVYSDAAWA